MTEAGAKAAAEATRVARISFIYKEYSDGRIRQKLVTKLVLENNIHSSNYFTDTTEAPSQWHSGPNGSGYHRGEQISNKRILSSVDRYDFFLP
jgi:hypothetical protein